MNVDIPILWAFDLNDSQWVVWCEHCLMLHRHGIGEGHRSSHCYAKSGGHKHGYILKHTGAEVPKEMLKADRKGQQYRWYRKRQCSRE